MSRATIAVGFAPAPPAQATALTIRIESFVAPYPGRAVQLDGPWEFRVPLLTTSRADTASGRPPRVPSSGRFRRCARNTRDRDVSRSGATGGQRQRLSLPSGPAVSAKRDQASPPGSEGPATHGLSAQCRLVVAASARLPSAPRAQRPGSPGSRSVSAPSLPAQRLHASRRAPRTADRCAWPPLLASYSPGSRTADRCAWPPLLASYSPGSRLAPRAARRQQVRARARAALLAAPNRPPVAVRASRWEPRSAPRSAWHSARRWGSG